MIIKADIYKKGRGKNLPANRNLIAGPYNRAGGFKEMAEKFIEANPDPENTKVKKNFKSCRRFYTIVDKLNNQM